MLDPLISGLVSGRQLKICQILVRRQCTQVELSSYMPCDKLKILCTIVPIHAECCSTGCALILKKKSDVATFVEVEAVVCISQMSKCAINLLAMKVIHPENTQHTFYPLQPTKYKFCKKLPGLPGEGHISWGPNKLAHTISPRTPQPHRFPQALEAWY